LLNWLMIIFTFTFNITNNKRINLIHSLLLLGFLSAHLFFVSFRFSSSHIQSRHVFFSNHIIIWLNLLWLWYTILFSKRKLSLRLYIFLWIKVSLLKVICLLIIFNSLETFYFWWLLNFLLLFNR